MRKILVLAGLAMMPLWVCKPDVNAQIDRKPAVMTKELIVLAAGLTRLLSLYHLKTFIKWAAGFGACLGNYEGKTLRSSSHIYKASEPPSPACENPLWREHDG